MHKLPTDQQIMQCIFEMYAQEYPHPKGAPKTERARVYVPIDVAAVAAKLRCDAELTFGRLYYHLDKNMAIPRTMAQKCICLP